MVAIEVAAEKATVDPSDGTARRKERKAANQMVRIGARNLASTLSKKCGRPPSRAKPNIMRELDVMEKSPQWYTQTMIKVINAMAPGSPKISIRIWVTG